MQLRSSAESRTRSPASVGVWREWGGSSARFRGHPRRISVGCRLGFSNLREWRKAEEPVPSRNSRAAGRPQSLPAASKGLSCSRERQPGATFADTGCSRGRFEARSEDVGVAFRGVGGVRGASSSLGRARNSPITSFKLSPFIRRCIDPQRPVANGQLRTVALPASPGEGLAKGSRASASERPSRGAEGNGSTHCFVLRCSRDCQELRPVRL